MDFTLIAIALVAGFPLGLLMKSATERRLRGGVRPWLPFVATNGRTLALNVLIKIGLVAVAIFAPPYFLLRAFGYLPIGGRRFQFFWCLYWLSVVLAKFARYVYWRRRCQSSLKCTR